MEGVLGTQDAYTNLVNSRWGEEDKTIRKITFRNCKTVHKRGPPNDRLYLVKGIGRCVEEGLELNVTYGSSFEVETDVQ